ncbi:restriction endonuclease subunit S [Sphingomonas adhaesiva]|jgi:type I restriction enzyme S subunit|uniref:restriction endonuclease subunit S n=1 Tax=Sphingomonas adhaesiva TaxID=28212 RepID=UPI0035C6ABE7
MEEWHECKLGDVIELKRGYDLPKHSRAAGSVPLVSSSGVSARISEAKVASPGVVTGRYGTIGQVFFIEEPFWPLNTTLYVRDFKGNDPRFIGYFLGRLDFMAYSDKAAVPGLNRNHLHQAIVRLPASKDEQAAIAAVLSALDDKIELNRRLNETLEASARALFRDWFVDFGPTRAKAEGRPAYLAPDLWSLFPDRLGDDGVPEGWEWSTIGEEVEAVGGSTPSTKDVALWDGGIAWTTPKDLSDLGSPILLDTARTITDAGLRTISSGLLPAGTVLMSSRAPVGYLAIASVALAVNQGYIAMKCTGRVSNWSAYLWAHENMGAIISNANGSTFQEISKKNFRPLPILVADDATRSAFDSLVGPMFESITANVIESRTLAATRDALLPKLMSGDIRVSSAEMNVIASL